MSRFSTIAWMLFVAAIFCGQTSWSDDATDRFNAAKQAFDLRQYEQSRAGFNEFLAKYPSHLQANEATFYLAESLLNQQQYDQASNYYTRLVSLGMNNPYARVAMFRLGDIPYIQGRFEIAKPRLEEFVEKLPHDTNLQFVLFYLGDIAMRADSPMEAEHYFGQSVRMFPSGERAAESQLGLAWAKNQLGNQTEANEIFRQLMNSGDQTVVELATYQWGVAQFERGDLQGASTTISGFLSRYPRSTYYTDAQRVMARCRGGSGDYNGALQIIAQISQPTIDDNLMKVRCLYGLGQINDAQTLLTGIERTAGPAYQDEIALLKSVFLYDQKNWSGTVATLSAFLLPQYNEMTGRMMFNYATMPLPSGGQKLSDESFMKACALLALAYAQNGDSVRAGATLTEMQGRVAMIGGNELQSIVTETSNRLSTIYVQNAKPGGNTSTNPGGNLIGGTQPGNPRPGGNRPGNNRPGHSSDGTSGSGQWTPGDGQVGNGRWPDQNPGGQWNPGQNTGSDSELERFWQASRMFDQRNWSGAAGILDQVLLTQYNQWAKQFYINYSVTGAQGAMDESTFARACSLLILSRANLGDFDQANAALSAFSGRIRSNDNVQQTLYRQTQDQLAQLARGASGGNWTPSTPGGYPGNMGNTNNGLQLAESEQRRVLRESNSLYSLKKFDQVEAKLTDLLAKNPVDAVRSEALLLRGKALFEQGREREAVLQLETIVREMPISSQYADALWFLGYYYEFCGDSFKAVEYFQLLADQFPNYRKIDGALYFLAQEDLVNGNGRKAETYLKRIYRNYQNGEYWSHAVWTLAYEAYKKKDYTQANLYVQKILHHPPDSAILDRVLYLRGELALRAKEYETAFIAFSEVGKLCPDSPLRDEAVRGAQLAGRSVLPTR